MESRTLLDEVVNTRKFTHGGDIGDAEIRVLVPSKQALRIDLNDLYRSVEYRMLRFERISWTVNNVERGAMPFKAYEPREGAGGHFYWIVSAYRCTVCGTAFIVPSVQDLTHKCTEPFE